MADTTKQITTGTKVQIGGDVYTVAQVEVRVSRIYADGWAAIVSFEEVDETLGMSDLVQIDDFEIVS